MKKYSNYYNKIQDEFNKMGWDFSKAVGRANPYNIVSNKTSFENFKKRVQKERKYNKSMDKVHKEYLEIQKRLEKGKKNKELSVREELRKQGLSKRSINKLMDMRKEYNMSKPQVLDKFERNKFLANKVINSLVNEFEYYDNEDNKKKSKKGAFNRFSKIPRVKEELEKFRKLIEKDDNALHKSEFVTEKFLREVIPLRYNDFKDKKQFQEPPEQFYVDLAKSLTSMYKKL